MSFSLAVVLLSALAVVALGLVVYNVLSRLHLLESAVQGGMQPPTRRLSREEFERQFSVAQSRAELATHFDTGVVLFLDSQSETAQAIIATLEHLPRHDLVHTVACDAAAATRLRANAVPHQTLAELGKELAVLGVSTLPFCFVVDDGAVRGSRHIGSHQALTALLNEHT